MSEESRVPSDIIKSNSNMRDQIVLDVLVFHQLIVFHQNVSLIKNFCYSLLVRERERKLKRLNFIYHVQIKLLNIFHEQMSDQSCSHRVLKKNATAFDYSMYFHRKDTIFHKNLIYNNFEYILKSKNMSIIYNL